jgi:predicted nucleotidyltransferase
VAAVLREIVRRAQGSLDLKRVLLFGSRARGDARPDSDLDLAFEHASSDATWAEFVNELHDAAPTLLPLDLVDLSKADPALRAKIEQQGQTLHG